MLLITRIDESMGKDSALVGPGSSGGSFLTLAVLRVTKASCCLKILIYALYL